jgi:hypothetical protein
VAGARLEESQGLRLCAEQRPELSRMLATNWLPPSSRPYFGVRFPTASAVRTNGLSAPFGFFSHLNIAYEA